MEFNEKEKKTVDDAIFIAIADLIANDKDQALNLALMALMLRYYIRSNKLPEGHINEHDINRQIVNLLVVFIEKTSQKISAQGQIPEAFTPIKFVFKVEAQIDYEGTTVPAHTVKINVTPKMLKDVNDIILKIGHEA